ncbi:hypothetical protein [Streptomyces halobius]|uniref:Secreted protein n=1 Tax=Streptomyces halobius TaxID=2879846 RepID=A0ABY4MBW7_9ACTN|nr:hypothetical protein [Streptomyces halobius]UQA93895.1 hypothetical protein K9S39_20260 [Streptomyces halobius]
MAKIQVGVFCRLVALAAAVILGLPTVVHGVRGGFSALTPSAFAAVGTSPACHWETAPGQRVGHPARAADEHHGTVHCRPRHGGRALATVSVPGPLSTPLSTSAPVPEVGGLAVTAPLTGRQAVPLSRSGELPVHHSVFRC